MSSSRSSNGTPASTTLLTAAVLVVLVAAALFAAFGGDDASPSDFELATIAAPVITGAGTAAAPGTAAPQVDGAALLDDGEVSLPVDGEGTMIVFLAHWCPHCNDEVPVVVDWLERDPLPAGVQVRAVATGIDAGAAHYPPDTWLAERDWTVPTVVDTDGSIGDAYGVTAYPSWVFVDADGAVVGRGGAQDQASLSGLARALAAD